MNTTLGITASAISAKMLICALLEIRMPGFALDGESKLVVCSEGGLGFEESLFDLGSALGNGG